MASLKCCYKQCSKPDEMLDSRIEVKTVLPKLDSWIKLEPKFKVNWKSSGEAEFHVSCWETLESLAQSRSRKASQGSLRKEEKVLIKTAAEAAEQFDSKETVIQRAKQAAELIKNSKHCVAFTGAGISTSAGIGDYRGKAGKWTEEDQNKANVHTVFDGAETENSDEPPSKRVKLESCPDDDEEPDGVPYETLRPTYTHEALVKLMETDMLQHIISQNGDGLHGLSGITEDKLSELHGNVFLEKCEKCNQRYHRKFYVLDDEGSQYYEELEDCGTTSVRKPKHAKKCGRCGLSHRTGRKCDKKSCGGQLMDTIINFRDLLEEDILETAKTNSRDCDVMLCLGTTLQVTPASDLVRKVKDKNKLIICNRQETPLDGQFVKKNSDGVSRGVRVFGDCDIFMKEIMKCILSPEDLQSWEAGRVNRMQTYDKQRDT